LGNALRRVASMSIGTGFPGDGTRWALGTEGTEGTERTGKTGKTAVERLVVVAGVL